MTVLNIWRCMLDLGWLLFLLVLFRHFWRDRKILVDAQSWLKVKGTITRCEWSECEQGIWPKIEYSYHIYGRDLIGEYLFLDTTHNNPNSTYSRGIAYKAALAFKEETEIDVYYNPNHPEQSALDVTIPIKLNVILIVIGLVIVLHVGIIAWHYLG